MSSSKKSHSDAAGKKSVFERLGSKSAGTEDYCKQWAHKGTCSYLSKCKFLETHTSKYYKGSSSSGKEGKKKSRSRSRSPLKKEKSKTKSPQKPTTKSGKSADGDSGDWEKSLDQEDELALERKLQMLQRELAKQEEQEHKGKLKKPVAKKRERSSSSSSTSSSTSSGSSSDSSASSSSSSSGSTSSSSSVSSSSDSQSDGEVKDKKYGKKKARKEVKRSHSSSSRNLPTSSSKEKSRAKPKKVAKLSPAVASRKKDGLSSGKKMNRINMSPKRQHAASSSAAKHREASPSFPQIIRSRSPRLKESSELPNRDRRMRRSPETSSENKRKLPPSSTHPPIRRRADESSPPPRERSRDGKPVAKTEKPRDRLLESGYIGRTRSPYRDSYPVREASPTGSAYRERSRAEPYDSRRGYSPTPTKLDRNKEDLYDTRPRRPVSPEVASLRRPVGSRPKDYHDYDHDWPPVSEPNKVNEWEHSDHRRRNRQLEDVNWNRASGSATDSSWKKAYCSPPTLGFLPTRDGANKRDRDRRIERPRELISRRPSEPVKLISPDPPTEDIENSSVAVVKTEETIADDVRPSSSAIDADEVENFSDFSDDVDEILNRDLQAQESDSLKVEEEVTVPTESEANNGEILPESELKLIVEPTGQSAGEVQISPKVLSPPASGVESRSTDEDLLGGMDIEQVSDEELEDESKAAPVDALEVDWASLACKREKKTDSGVQGARQRWGGKAVLARLGIASSDGKQQSKVPEKKSLFDCSNLFRRALSARMDLSLRRSLCNLPVRELVLMEHFDDDLNLFKASVDLMFKERSALLN